MTRPARQARKGSGRHGARQRGNALVFALLGLMLTSMTVVGTMRARRFDQKRTTGTTEATILLNLGNAVNAAIYEQVVQLQAGNPLVANGVAVVVPTTNAQGQLEWSPSIDNLVAMNYLPPNWSLKTSNLNNAPYRVVFTRRPAGCAPANCGIEGHVFLAGPIGVGLKATEFEGVVVGAILGRIGADAGVSLQGSGAEITGFGNTWSVENPVAGSPAGVVAVRVGTASGQFSQFVRINDSRDPNLQGNFTLAGAATLAGTLSVAGTTALRGATTLTGADLQVNAADGTNCVQLTPTGSVDIRCAGTLNAITGTFADAAGNSTAVAPGAVSATGTISAGSNLVAAGNVVGNRVKLVGTAVPGAACTEVNELAGNAVSGGLVLCSGGAWRAFATQSTAGQACSPEGGLAQQPDGATLLCRGATYVPLTQFARRGTVGQACSDLGAAAVDVSTGESVLCRANPGGGTAIWYRMQDLTTNLQFVASTEVVDGQVINKPVCGSSTSYTGQPVLWVMGKAEGSSDASFSRYAVDNGASWTVFLRDSAGNVLEGTTTSGSAVALAQQYCYYP